MPMPYMRASKLVATLPPPPISIKLASIKLANCLARKPHITEHLQTYVHHVVLRVPRLLPAWIVSDLVLEVVQADTTGLALGIKAVQGLLDRGVHDVDRVVRYLKFVRHETHVRCRDLPHRGTGVDVLLVSRGQGLGLLSDLV